jgi:hypothetical protein
MSRESGSAWAGIPKQDSSNSSGLTRVFIYQLSLSSSAIRQPSDVLTQFSVLLLTLLKWLAL